MSRKLTFQAAFVASLAAVAGIVVMLLATNGLPAGTSLQPTVAAAAEFANLISAYPDNTLAFFAGDTLFVLSYSLAFVGLYTVTAERSRPFALVGLGAGLLLALFDHAENAHYITYALMAKNGVEVTDPALPLVFLLGTLKWTASFLTLYAFGLAFPRRTVLEKVIFALMLVYPVFGVLSVAFPALIAWRGLFLLGGMMLFAAYFWRQVSLADRV